VHLLRSQWAVYFDSAALASTGLAAVGDLLAVTQ
jgi:hypothetical protein